MRLAGPLLLAGEELAMFEEIKFEPDVFCEKVNPTTQTLNPKPLTINPKP